MWDENYIQLNLKFYKIDFVYAYTNQGQFCSYSNERLDSISVQLVWLVAIYINWTKAQFEIQRCEVRRDEGEAKKECLMD